jgi:type I restriction enzyme S subunit
MKPGYKQTEVGTIPNDWTVSTVGNEFNIKLGKMLDAEKNVGVPKPFLGNSSVQWGHIDVSDLGEIRLSPTDLQRFRLKRGDLLVCEGGDVGRAAIWRDQLDECYYQKALHRLRPKRGYSIELMRNLLEKMSASGLLQNYVTQTSIAHLPKDKFEAVPIPVPSTKAEQNAIAEALSDADSLIESLEQLLAKKRDLKQGAMQELLTGNRRLQGHQKADARSKHTEIGTIPEDWGVSTIGKLATTSSGTTPPRAMAERYFHNGTIPWVKTLDLNNSSIRSVDEMVTPAALAETSLQLYPPGSVLVAMYGGHNQIGRTGLLLEPATVNQALTAIRPEGQRLNSEYLLRVLNYNVEYWKSVASSSRKDPNITGKDVQQFPLAVPPLAEQAAIATILADMDAEITVLESNLTKARQLKQGMMQELLTGRIRLI